MALVAGILRFVIPPRAVAGQIFQQMLPHIFVLRADQPQAQQNVRNVKAGLSPTGVLCASVFCWLIACAEIAIASTMLALTSPACSVALNSRNSTVPW